MPDESIMLKFKFLRSLPNLIILGLFFSAFGFLVQFGFVTLKDIIFWNKSDIGAILFESRTGQSISLGIGIVVIHYLIIGISLLATGVTIFKRNRILALFHQEIPMQSQKASSKKTIVNEAINLKSDVENNRREENGYPSEEMFFSGCRHHFSYLSSRPKGSPIPPECIICQRLGDCMVATIYEEEIIR